MEVDVVTSSISVGIPSDQNQNSNICNLAGRENSTDIISSTVNSTRPSTLTSSGSNPNKTSQPNTVEESNQKGTNNVSSSLTEGTMDSENQPITSSETSNESLASSESKMEIEMNPENNVDEIKPTDEPVPSTSAEPGNSQENATASTVGENAGNVPIKPPSEKPVAEFKIPWNKFEYSKGSFHAWTDFKNKVKLTEAEMLNQYTSLLKADESKYYKMKTNPFSFVVPPKIQKLQKNLRESVMKLNPLNKDNDIICNMDELRSIGQKIIECPVRLSGGREVNENNFMMMKLLVVKFFHQLATKLDSVEIAVRGHLFQNKLCMLRGILLAVIIRNRRLTDEEVADDFMAITTAFNRLFSKFYIGQSFLMAHRAIKFRRPALKDIFLTTFKKGNAPANFPSFEFGAMVYVFNEWLCMTPVLVDRHKIRSIANTFCTDKNITKCQVVAKYLPVLQTNDFAMNIVLDKIRRPNLRSIANSIRFSLRSAVSSRTIDVDEDDDDDPNESCEKVVNDVPEVTEKPALCDINEQCLEDSVWWLNNLIVKKKALQKQLTMPSECIDLISDDEDDDIVYVEDDTTSDVPETINVDEDDTETDVVSLKTKSMVQNPSEIQVSTRVCSPTDSGFMSQTSSSQASPNPELSNKQNSMNFEQNTSNDIATREPIDFHKMIDYQMDPEIANKNLSEVPALLYAVNKLAIDRQNNKKNRSVEKEGETSNTLNQKKDEISTIPTNCDIANIPKLMDHSGLNATLDIEKETEKTEKQDDVEHHSLPIDKIIPANSSSAKEENKIVLANSFVTKQSVATELGAEKQQKKGESDKPLNGVKLAGTKISVVKKKHEKFEQRFKYKNWKSLYKYKSKLGYRSIITSKDKASQKSNYESIHLLMNNAKEVKSTVEFMEIESNGHTKVDIKTTLPDSRIINQNESTIAMEAEVCSKTPIDLISGNKLISSVSTTVDTEIAMKTENSSKASMDFKSVCSSKTMASDVTDLLSSVDVNEKILENSTVFENAGDDDTKCTDKIHNTELKSISLEESTEQVSCVRKPFNETPSDSDSLEIISNQISTEVIEKSSHVESVDNHEISNKSLGDISLDIVCKISQSDNLKETEEDKSKEIEDVMPKNSDIVSDIVKFNSSKEIEGEKSTDPKETNSVDIPLVSVSEISKLTNSKETEDVTFKKSDISSVSANTVSKSSISKETENVTFKNSDISSVTVSEVLKLNIYKETEDIKFKYSDTSSDMVNGILNSNISKETEDIKSKNSDTVSEVSKTTNSNETEDVILKNSDNSSEIVSEISKTANSNETEDVISKNSDNSSEIVSEISKATEITANVESKTTDIASKLLNSKDSKETEEVDLKNLSISSDIVVEILKSTGAKEKENVNSKNSDVSLHTASKNSKNTDCIKKQDVELKNGEKSSLEESDGQKLSQPKSEIMVSSLQLPSQQLSDEQICKVLLDEMINKFEEKSNNQFDEKSKSLNEVQSAPDSVFKGTVNSISKSDKADGNELTANTSDDCKEKRRKRKHRKRDHDKSKERPRKESSKSTKAKSKKMVDTISGNNNNRLEINKIQNDIKENNQTECHYKITVLNEEADIPVNRSGNKTYSKRGNNANNNFCMYSPNDVEDPTVKTPTQSELLEMQLSTTIMPTMEITFSTLCSSPESVINLSAEEAEKLLVRPSLPSTSLLTPVTNEVDVVKCLEESINFIENPTQCIEDPIKSLENPESFIEDSLKCIENTLKCIENPNPEPPDDIASPDIETFSTEDINDFDKLKKVYIKLEPNNESPSASEVNTSIPISTIDLVAEESMNIPTINNIDTEKITHQVPNIAEPSTSKSQDRVLFTTKMTKDGKSTTNCYIPECDVEYGGIPGCALFRPDGLVNNLLQKVYTDFGKKAKKRRKQYIREETNENEEAPARIKYRRSITPQLVHWKHLANEKPRETGKRVNLEMYTERIAFGARNVELDESATMDDAMSQFDIDSCASDTNEPNGRIGRKRKRKKRSVRQLNNIDSYLKKIKPAYGREIDVTDRDSSEVSSVQRSERVSDDLAPSGENEHVSTHPFRGSIKPINKDLVEFWKRKDPKLFRCYVRLKKPSKSKADFKKINTKEKKKRLVPLKDDSTFTKIQTRRQTLSAQAKAVPVSIKKRRNTESACVIQRRSVRKTISTDRFNPCADNSYGVKRTVVPIAKRRRTTCSKSTSNKKSGKKNQVNITEDTSHLENIVIKEEYDSSLYNTMEEHIYDSLDEIERGDSDVPYAPKKIVNRRKAMDGYDACRAEESDGSVSIENDPVIETSDESPRRDVYISASKTIRNLNELMNRSFSSPIIKEESIDIPADSADSEVCKTSSNLPLQSEVGTIRKHLNSAEVDLENENLAFGESINSPKLKIRNNLGNKIRTRRKTFNPVFVEKKLNRESRFSNYISNEKIKDSKTIKCNKTLRRRCKTLGTELIIKEKRSRSKSSDKRRLIKSLTLDVAKDKPILLLLSIPRHSLGDTSHENSKPNKILRPRRKTLGAELFDCKNINREKRARSQSSDKRAVLRSLALDNEVEFLTELRYPKSGLFEKSLDNSKSNKILRPRCKTLGPDMVGNQINREKRARSQSSDKRGALKSITPDYAEDKPLVLPQYNIPIRKRDGPSAGQNSNKLFLSLDAAFKKNT